MHYYHVLGTVAGDEGGKWTSSQAISRQLHLDDSQVRRDLARIGLRGHARRGFRREEVVDTIKDVLGLDRRRAAVIVGAGRLGMALASYGGFPPYGLIIVGLFDNNPDVIGREAGRPAVRDVQDLPEFLGKVWLDVGIITVPAEGAQDVARTLMAGGVRAIWNFAPVNIDAPSGFLVRNEHISVGLGELAYFLTQE